MPGSAFSSIADRLLKRSESSQPAPGTGTPSSPKNALSRRASTATLRPVPETDRNEVIGGGGMVSNRLGGSPHLSANSSAWITKSRPLSDIRELTEPSLADSGPRNHLQESLVAERNSASRNPCRLSQQRSSTDNRLSENRVCDGQNISSWGEDGSGFGVNGRRRRSPPPQNPPKTTYTSIYDIPRDSIPPRSSSQGRTRSNSHPSALRLVSSQAAVAPKLRTAPRLPAHPLHGPGNTIPRHGPSVSPLRGVAARLDHARNEREPPTPSETFIREPVSSELLGFPTHRHPRVHLAVDLSAGIFVGGGTIEGAAQIRIDDPDRIVHQKPLDIARISVDLLGLEEIDGHKRAVFLNLANELIDSDNPPPRSMVNSQVQIGVADPFWHLKPSLTHLPFIMSLPLNVGPPPFQSKHARIRYLLCVSLLIREQGKQYIVRTSEDISVISVYDRKTYPYTIFPRLTYNS